jgi:23S rRNA (guanosine2251-2'-O)-methyltransferase
MANTEEAVALLGFHAVRARLRAAPNTIDRILVDAQRKDGRLKALLEEARLANCRVTPVEASALDEWAKGERHQGVLALAQARKAPDDLKGLLHQLRAQSATGQMIVALDGVTDPHNLGAILRTADAAGVLAVISPKDHGAPLNEVAVRVSAGGADRVPYLRVPNLARALETLQEEGFQVLGLDSDVGASLYDADLRGPIAFVLGAEGSGLRRLTREGCDALLSVPMVGSVESLNVSVAAGVVFFEALRQRRLAPRQSSDEAAGVR